MLLDSQVRQRMLWRGYGMVEMVERKEIATRGESYLIDYHDTQSGKLRLVTPLSSGSSALQEIQGHNLNSASASRTKALPDPGHATTSCCLILSHVITAIIFNTSFCTKASASKIRPCSHVHCGVVSDRKWQVLA